MKLTFFTILVQSFLLFIFRTVKGETGNAHKLHIRASRNMLEHVLYLNNASAFLIMTSIKYYKRESLEIVLSFIFYDNIYL